MGGKIAAGEYTNTHKHEESDVSINWTIAGDTIYFGVESKTNGWTGLSFNPSGDKRAGAHMIMWCLEANKLSIHDMYVTHRAGAPTPVERGGGKSGILASADTQVVEFSYKLAANNAKSDVTLLQGKEGAILLAQGDSPSLAKQHRRNSRWLFKVNLRQPRMALCAQPTAGLAPLILGRR